MKRIHHPLCLAVLALTLVACGGTKKSDEVEQIAEMAVQKVNENYVDTLVLRPVTFNQQIKCNGKLKAQAKSELVMPTSGILHSIQVKNGSQVAKGDLLATVDKEEAQRALTQSERDEEKAKMDLIDKLIGLGYDDDLSKVPAELLTRIEITSGYASARHNLETARTNLAKCNLYAPFSGRVADMDCKLYQRAEKFCTLIDDTWFDVEFSVLEAELPSMGNGRAVRVSPFIDENRVFDGQITEINPVVDEKGQVKVRAKIRNAQNYLVEGMNVKVIVENELKNMFVVPKDAVVMRDGYAVIFCYQEGQAVWTYVDILHTNITSHAITGNQKKETKLNVGDVVITSGNLNLADGTQVIARAPQAGNNSKKR